MQISIGIVGVSLDWSTRGEDPYGGKPHPDNQLGDNIWLANRTDLWSGPQIVCACSSSEVDTMIETIGKVLELMRVGHLLPVSPTDVTGDPDLAGRIWPGSWRWDKHAWFSETITVDEVRDMRGALPIWRERDHYLDPAVEKLEEALLSDIRARSVSWAIAAMDGLLGEVQFPRERAKFVAHAIADLASDHPERLHWVRTAIKECYSKVRSGDFHEKDLEDIEFALGAIGRHEDVARLKGELVGEVLEKASKTIMRFHERLSRGEGRGNVLRQLATSYQTRDYD